MEDGKTLNPKVSTKRFWYALYTKPKHEFKAAEYLKSLELENYLPTLTSIKQWSDRKKKVTEPLFKGYLFICCNELERFEALQDPSIISTVSFQGKPAKIPEWQIQNLKRMLDENREIFVEESIKVGEKVKVIEGPFKDVIGSVTQSDEHGKMLGITIDLLRRSVLVKLPADSITKVIEKDENESATIE